MENQPTTPVNNTPADAQVASAGGLLDNLGPALGLLVIRLWLGVRSFLSGVEKFAGSKSSEELVVIDGEENAWGLTDTASEKVYSLSNYQGIPESMESRFMAEPLLPEFALTAYGYILGPALLILGATVLLGILPRISLFLMGLLYLSLTVGLVLINQDAGVAWLAAHIILIGIALIYAGRDRFVLLGKKW